MSIFKALPAIILTLSMPFPALAGYKRMPDGVPVQVAKSGLQVAPAQDWNRLDSRPGRNAESWTLDGLTLNELTFYGGIADNQTLFREADKDNAPLPRFSATMLIPDVAQFFEASYRVVSGSALIAMESIEPAPFAGASGFRFTYGYTLQNDEVKRRGEARGAIIGGKLYMITFEAPAIHYFARDVAAFRKMADAARIVETRKKK